MNIPKPLLDDIASGKCLPFIGAGFSLNATLPEGEVMPDWSGLTQSFMIDIGATKPKNGPDIAMDYERQFGRVQLIEKIRDVLHSDTAEPGEAHLAFVQLPFDTIYTTNFDLLIEDACVGIHKPYRSLVGELQLPFHGGPLTTNIVKMHGDLRHEEHIVLNRDDYDSFLDKYPVISTHLSAMLITRTALFVGYSLTDPDFNQIREVVRSRLGRFQRMSYIIQFNQTSAQINKMLNEHLHVINFKVKKSDSIDEVLAKFFSNIQEELDVIAGKKIRARKPEAFEEVSDTTLEATNRAPNSSVLLSSSSNLCFVLMPFDEVFYEIYKNLIQPAVVQAGLEPLRADDIFSPGPIIEQIRSAIQQSRVCIADISGRNPNVLYELGIAQTLGKPTVLISQDITNVPFDVQHLRIIQYSYDIKKLQSAQSQLINALEQTLGYDRIAEVRRLIQSGMYRAAVATLSVLLEQSMRTLLIRNKLIDSEGRDKRQKLLSMGQMVHILYNAKIITEQETAQLRDITTIRNQTVHGLREPDKSQAEMFFSFLQEFIQKYL